jgi:uncharacterized protein GlcG (DUF336 family)
VIGVLDVEKGVSEMSDISLEQADSVVHGTLAAARKVGAAPLAVVVLDRAGHVVCVKREDGATMFRFDIALGKGWGAAAFGQSSRGLAAKAARNPNFFSALSATSRGRLLPNPGGVPIYDHSGNLVGAVGVSGDSGDKDEEFAISGIESAGLRMTSVQGAGGE